ncbi:MAG: DUF6017 domain-containing protein [Eubacteriales bacterium]|nr:DUF6017 domain-containing protein [Eubacteriales bacterium]
MQKIQFDYFRGMEADQYSFYRVPKVLFTEKCFRSLSCEAKVLYGLLLDRMGLSIKNRWFDEEDKVYIIFTVEEIAELLNCGTQKAVKLLKELDSVSGIGLIEKKRLGLGKPNVIYVKNFMLVECAQEDADTKNCENHNSGMVKTTIQEYPKSQSNNTDTNKTEYSDTDLIKSYPSGEEMWEKEDAMDQMGMYRATIRKNIEYDILLEDGRMGMDILDEMVELIVEVLMMPEGSRVRIAGVDKPVGIVKSRFMKLSMGHIQYVTESLRKNTSKVGNIKSYLLTTLYNSTLTIGNYYQAEVNHDLYGGGWSECP